MKKIITEHKFLSVFIFIICIYIINVAWISVINPLQKSSYSLEILQGSQGFGAGTVWLNDSQLLAASSSLFIFDLKKNKDPLPLMVEGFNGGDFSCSYQNLIDYRERITGEYFRLILPKEKDLLDGSKILVQKGEYPQCAPSSSKEQRIDVIKQSMNTGEIVLLRPEHGYILFTRDPELENDPDIISHGYKDAQKMVSSDGKIVKDVNLGLLLFRTGLNFPNQMIEFEWNEKEGKYLYVSEYYLDGQKRRVIGWLSPDGSSDYTVLPDGSINNNLHMYSLDGVNDYQVISTSVGYVMSFIYEKDSKSNHYRKGSGVYLLTREGTVSKIVSGFADNLSVSPNGCDIAFNYVTDLKYGNWSYHINYEDSQIVTVNVCKQ